MWPHERACVWCPLGKYQNRGGQLSCISCTHGPNRRHENTSLFHSSETAACCVGVECSWDQTDTLAVLVTALALLVGALVFVGWKKRRLEDLRRRQNAEQVRAMYGVRLVGQMGTMVLGGKEAKQLHLDGNSEGGDGGTDALVRYFCRETGDNEHGAVLQCFVTAEEKVIWVPYKPVTKEFEFAAFVGFKLRVVTRPPRLPAAGTGTAEGRVPVPMRGITVAQLKQFHADFPGANSREKQEQLKEECPPHLSYFEWKLEELCGEDRGQMPQAIVSYSWVR